MFTRNQALLEHQFVNNDEFKAELDDIGTPFSHPIKTQLMLSDLFVYPDLKVTTFRAKAGPEVVMRGPDVLDYVAGKRSLCIAGAPTSGKTSLGKMLYRDLQLRKKLVPVLLQPHDIRGTDASRVRAAVARAFEEQYSKRLLDRFNQLEPESKVVIVDDWHRVRFGAKGKAQVVEGLDRTFGRVIVFTDDASMFHQMADAVSSGVLPSFEYCEIKPFGYRLREELVTKWESLGREFETEELELTHDIATSEYLLDALIGKGIVPAYPFFVLSALQADDLTAQNAAFGAYGHIYQALLTTRMARVNPKNLGLKFAYLSFLAYKMLETGRDSLTAAEVQSIHDSYEREYMVSVDKAQLLAELEAAQALSVSGEQTRFKYRYAYYYFAAQYLHDGISNVKGAEALRQKLKALADNAYNEENAHILIFYLYMSKDRVLMEHILDNAKKLFADKGPCDLDSDVAFVNALYSAPPRLVAPSPETERNREEYLAQRDEAAESQRENEPGQDKDMLTLDFAFQSLNIMGQVLRNFPGDLRADLKLRLTQESYQLGLRILRGFLVFLQTNIEAFRRDMVEYLKLFQPFSRKRDDQLQAAADKAVIALTEMALFGIIKRISMSVGVEELKETYETVRGMAGEDHIPTRMIDLLIKLDHFARIPEADVKDLKERLQANPAVYTTLRMFVGEFLYLFPVDYKVRQRMIELLDFQPGAPTLSADKRVKKLKATSE